MELSSFRLGAVVKNSLVLSPLLLRWVCATSGALKKTPKHSTHGYISETWAAFLTLNSIHGYTGPTSPQLSV